MSSTLIILFLLVLAVLALGWVVCQAQKEGADRTRRLLRWLLSVGLLVVVVLLMRKLGRLNDNGMFANFFVVLFLVGVIALCAIVFGLLWAPQFGSWVARPIMSLFEGGSQEIEPRPLYAIAQAHRKRGRYPEAIAEIQRQLRGFPGDFDGTLLLAEIEAERGQDITVAIGILENWIPEWGQHSNRVPAALSQIADWHLLCHDPDAAKAALERIVELFPDSEAAHVARQRLSHLASGETLADRANPHRIQMGQYPARVGLMLDPPKPPPPQDPSALAADYVRQLEQFPDDNETRENLARLYAEEFHHPALARQELEWLLAQPKAPQRQIVHWLNLLAHLELDTVGDISAARAALERIVTRFPKSAAAQQARQRIGLLALELRGKQKSRTFRLGSSDNDRPPR